jgi:uncharacterized phage-associated protein
MARIFDFKERMEIDMYPTNVTQVADYFLTQESMTHKKLQKLCFYAYAWNFALNNVRLFPNRFEAWIHGPVYPSLYQDYKDMGWQNIGKLEEHNITNSEILGLLERVWETYGDSSGDELEFLTHRERPWIEARKGLSEWEASNNNIDDETIQTYYLSIYEQGQND